MKGEERERRQSLMFLPRNGGLPSRLFAVRERKDVQEDHRLPDARLPPLEVMKRGFGISQSHLNPLEV